MSKLHLKWRMILPIALCLFIGVNLLNTYIYLSFSSEVVSLSSKQAADLSMNYANRVSTDMLSVLGTTKGTATVLTNQIANNLADRDAWISSFELILTENSEIQAIYLYTEPNAFDGLDEQFRSIDYHDALGNYAPYLVLNNGRISVTTLNLAEHQRNGYYQQAQNSSKEFISNPVLKNGVLTATAIVPLRMQNRFIGFLATEMNFVNIGAELSAEKMTFPNAYISIMSPDGYIVANKTPSLVGQNSFETSSPEVAQLFKNVISSKQAQSKIAYSATVNADCEYSASPVNIISGADPWLVSVAVPQTDVYAPVYETIFTILIVVLVVTTLSLITLYIIINTSSTALSGMSDRLSEATHAVLSASAQIASSGDILAQGGVQQAAGIEETSATMNQTAAMIQENTELTAAISALSDEAVHAAHEGLELVEALAVSMRKLESSSAEISKIVSIIDNIAFQTNILALNASVEAARVGDTGKGFSVVAEEVRGLANRSAEAVSNTSIIIERNLQLSRRSVASASEVSRALSEISLKNTEVNNLVVEINRASQEQVTGISQIKIALSQMEDVTQSNAAVAEENSAAASELDVQAHDLGAIQERLNTTINGVERKQAVPSTERNARKRNEQARPRALRPGNRALGK